MTEITWNETGSRLVETGISKGVLYSPDGTIVVPWNGLTAVTENGSRTASVYYVDGQKYLDTQIPTDYQATLEAFSYPPEFDAFNGIASYGGDTPIPGLLIYDQNPSQFHLSYQTKVGNDVDGLDHGYRIHVIFNVLAQLSERAYETVSDSVTPINFSWDLTSTPESLTGYRATAHIVFDSNTLNPIIMALVEKILYGDDDTDPELGTLQDFIDRITAPSIASFSISPSSPTHGDSVTFDGSESLPSILGTSIDTFSWRLLGPSPTAEITGATPTFTYTIADAGDYIMYLLVIDNVGSTNLTSIDFTVS